VAVGGPVWMDAIKVLGHALDMLHSVLNTLADLARTFVRRDDMRLFAFMGIMALSLFLASCGQGPPGPKGDPGPPGRKARRETGVPPGRPA